MKLIGFCGAGGTGKTTTAKELAHLTGTHFQPSSNRSVYKARGLTEADQNKMTPQEALNFQIELWNAKRYNDICALQGHTLSILDRTPMDQFTYMMWRCWGALTEEVFVGLKDRTFHWMQPYEAIFYFPLVTFPGQEDGLRENAWGGRKLFDSLLQQNLRDFGLWECTYVIQPDKNPAERAMEIRDWLIADGLL